MATLAFWSAIGFLVTHELDAMRRHEWRVLPMTSFLPDHIGRTVFLWAHVPIMLLLAWIVTNGPDSRSAILFSGFAVLHLVAHLLYSNNPANEFSGLSSWLLIIGPAAFGAAHLALIC